MSEIENDVGCSADALMQAMLGSDLESIAREHGVDTSEVLVTWAPVRGAIGYDFYDFVHGDTVEHPIYDFEPLEDPDAPDAALTTIESEGPGMLIEELLDQSTIDFLKKRDKR